MMANPIDEMMEDEEGSYANSDISLGSDLDSDAIMADTDEYDDDSTLGSNENEEIEDIDLEDSNSINDDDCEPLEYEDSLHLTVVTTNLGTTMLEVKGTVPLQKAGHLTIMSRLERSTPLPFITNILLLADPQALKELRICQASLLGSIKEYEDFSRALRSLHSMEELHLVDCCLLNTSGSRPLDTILYGVSCNVHTLPKLRHIELYAVDIDLEPVGSFLSAAALAHLIRNKPALTKLSFEDLTLEDDHVIELAGALEHHDNLKMLKLWGCAVSDRGMEAMAHMLEKNTSVQQLEFSYNDIGDIGCIAIAKSLRVNKTLNDLRLVQNEKIVHGGKGYQALLEMMKWNHVIEELLLQPSPKVDSDLGFYLFVNRHRYLLEDENITKIQLVDLLHTHRIDTTFLFLFLKAKPTLCGD